MPKTIINEVTVLEGGRRPHQCVVIEGERISAVVPSSSVHVGDSDILIEGRGRMLSPGYMDLHIHGTRNLLVDGGRKSLEELCEVLPRYGVTGFLPTVAPRAEGEDARHLADLAQARSDSTLILGFFLEGPFLALTGALPAEACGKPNERRIASLIDAAAPYRAVFAVAPDLDEAAQFIPMMAGDGNPVFITHTAANVEQTQAAIEAGARHATHFYDVFPHPAVADPGVRPSGAAEAILADERVSVDFILDGEHVHPVAVKMALACKGPDKVCLITDANLGAGLPPGIYEGVGGEIEFAYPGAPARTTAKSATPGVLAGSGLTLDRAVRNATEMLGVAIEDAVRMASTNPARVLKIDHERGHIREGYYADLVLLSDQAEVEATWVNGRCLFERGEVS